MGKGSLDTFVVISVRQHPCAERLESRTLLAATAELVADVNAYTPSSSFSNMVAVGDNAFFGLVVNGTSQLWKTDGTAAGTQLAWTTPAATSGVVALASGATRVYFSNKEGNDAFKVWASDGTAAGTV